MTLRLGNVTFDCDDTLAVAQFWSAALERPLDADSNGFFATIGRADDAMTTWMFLKVPEAKTAKNGCHVDLRTESREAVQAEVDRLTALGATVIRTPKEEFGMYRAALQDPEGNERLRG